MDPRRLVILGIVAAISAVIGLAAWWQAPASQPTAPGVSAPVSGDASRSSPSAPAAATAEKKAPPPPSFDIARVEPNGDAVIAGRAAPGSDVELLANGGVVDRTKADQAGEFVLSPPPFAPGDYQLTLRSGGLTSEKTITVSVPAAGKGDVLVVASEAGKPSEIVAAGPAQPSAPAAAVVSPAAKELAAAADPELKIGAVEAEGGRLFVQGTGPAGVRVVIYLNNQPVANGVVGQDQKWSLTVEKGLDPGQYDVRVDQVGDDGKVTARAEVPFLSGASKPVDAAGLPALQTAAVDVAAPPDTPPAETAANAQSAPASVDNPANIVVKALDTLKVQRGDNLWRISRRTYGRGIRYSTIYQANTQQIRNPNRIYPGQIFVMPPRT